MKILHQKYNNYLRILVRETTQSEITQSENDVSQNMKYFD